MVGSARGRAAAAVAGSHSADRLVGLTAGKLFARPRILDKAYAGRIARGRWISLAGLVGDKQRLNPQRVSDAALGGAPIKLRGAPVLVLHDAHRVID